MLFHITDYVSFFCVIANNHFRSEIGKKKLPCLPWPNPFPHTHTTHVRNLRYVHSGFLVLLSHFMYLILNCPEGCPWWCVLWLENVEEPDTGNELYEGSVRLLFITLTAVCNVFLWVYLFNIIFPLFYNIHGTQTISDTMSHYMHSTNRMPIAHSKCLINPQWVKEVNKLMGVFSLRS